MKRKIFRRAAFAVCLAALMTASAFAAELKIQPVSGVERRYTVSIPKNVTLLLASYEKSGKMKSVSFLHTAETGEGEIRVNFDLPNGAIVKAFFLTGSVTPIKVQEKREWATEPYQSGGSFELPGDTL